jgi:hypothetical protein
MAAELLFEKWLHARGYKFAHRFRRVQQGPISKAHDGFGALDFLVLDSERDGFWGVQVTTQAGRCARRRKIEAVPWPSDFYVLLVSHETTQDPAHRGRRLNFWRVEQYERGVADLSFAWHPAEAWEFDKTKTIETWREDHAEQSHSVGTAVR